MNTPFGKIPRVPPFSVSGYNRHAQITEALANQSGALVSGSGGVAQRPARADTLFRQRSQTIYGRITAWKKVAGVERFFYAGFQIGFTLTDQGSGLPPRPDEFLLPGGREWSLTWPTPANKYPPLWNFKELNNVAHLAGTQGNSVKENRPGFPSSFYLQPLGGGYTGAQTQGTAEVQVPVEAWLVRTLDGDFWMCDEINSHDGGCP